MTRINCIPPECLLDQHLLAEYNRQPIDVEAWRKKYSEWAFKPV